MGTLGPQDPTWDSSPADVVAAVATGGVGDAAAVTAAASIQSTEA
ncbi:hypothetical protein [Streptomyces yaizuensis]|uniref:Uncharacterized protein n=1 Tax=Streptomyces yaizuensis TaxID=2989713 RepID=A0ABQ5NZX2_9ACTN|nr:hypothetical protein [Streptomyces sp. YSPA8]GLF95905.1 hypothetical protein SYYSPA8_16430 [Streptomyces sp. YSPA8]